LVCSSKLLIFGELIFDADAVVGSSICQVTCIVDELELIIFRLGAEGGSEEEIEKMDF
jgi:hypothetical protein